MTLADKIAHARARMQLLGIEPITTRVCIAHIAPPPKPAPEQPLPKSVTKIRRTA